MKIYLAADHAGFAFKETVKKFLVKEDYEIEDCGTFSFDKNDDYPDFIAKAARKTANDPSSFGIIFGKSGAGEAIVANKIKGIRAVLGFTKENVTLARTHNNANVLSLGSEFVANDNAYDLIQLFLKTPFSNEERHVRRINKIKEIESGL